MNKSDHDPEPFQTLAEHIFGVNKGQWFPTQAEAADVAGVARLALTAGSAEPDPADIAGYMWRGAPNERWNYQRDRPVTAGIEVVPLCRSGQSRSASPPATEPTFWWNGIHDDPCDESSVKSFSRTENTWHDIPLYAGVNPCNLEGAATVMPAAPEEPTDEQSEADRLREVVKDAKHAAWDSYSGESRVEYWAHSGGWNAAINAVAALRPTAPSDFSDGALQSAREKAIWKAAQTDADRWAGRAWPATMVVADTTNPQYARGWNNAIVACRAASPSPTSSAPAEPADEGCCEECGKEMSVPFDMEPTRFCNECAHNIAERSRLIEARTESGALYYTNCLCAECVAKSALASSVPPEQPTSAERDQ